MQKILLQDLSGTEEEAKKNAIYTWEKNQVAWLFDPIYTRVLKIKFTGERWLYGNEHQRNKIYQYKILESLSDPGSVYATSDINCITHGPENMFYTTPLDACQLGFAYIGNKREEALKEYARGLKSLSYFSDLIKK